MKMATPQDVREIVGAGASGRIGGPRRRRRVEAGRNGRAQLGQRELARRLSFPVAYDLWLGSWETALAALATATQNGTLSTNEAAAHKAVISAEHEFVTQKFTLLLGHTPARQAG
jgi:hypothetical protein